MGKAAKQRVWSAIARTCLFKHTHQRHEISLQDVFELLVLLLLAFLKAEPEQISVPSLLLNNNAGTLHSGDIVGAAPRLGRLVDGFLLLVVLQTSKTLGSQAFHLSGHQWRSWAQNHVNVVRVRYLVTPDQGRSNTELEAFALAITAVAELRCAPELAPFLGFKFNK